MKVDRSIIKAIIVNNHPAVAENMVTYTDDPSWLEAKPIELADELEMISKSTYRDDLYEILSVPYLSENPVEAAEQYYEALEADKSTPLIQVLNPYLDTAKSNQIFQSESLALLVCMAIGLLILFLWRKISK